MNREDILRGVTGEESQRIETPVIEPTSALSKVKASVVNTTDKMGITTAGTFTRTLAWGIVFGTVGVLALGYWKDKISITYSK